jgi:hypothetical protein
LRIVFDKNVPVGVRRFLTQHEVRTFPEMQWHPQLENGKLLDTAEAAGFDLMVTSDQNIRYQQNGDRTEAVPHRPWAEYLAGGAGARSGDRERSRWSNTRKLRLHRNAAAAEAPVGHLLQRTSPRPHQISSLPATIKIVGAFALLVFFAFALQCMSTVAVVRRETGGWKWPAVQFAYMTGLAYVCAFAANKLRS